MAMPKLPIAIITGGIAGLTCWFLWTGISMAQSSRDFENWTDLVSQEFSSAAPPCRGGWEEAGSEAICEDLRHPPTSAQKSPTSAVFAVDEQSGRIESMRFSIRPYRPTSDQRADGSRSLSTWADAVREQIGDDCRPGPASYAGGGWWDCDGLIIAHTGDIDDGEGLAVHLWIGRDTPALRSSFDDRGRAEHILRARRHIARANDYLTADQYAAAHRTISRAWFLLDVIPDAHVDADVLRLRRELEDGRSKIADHAAAQRERLGSPAPLPAFSADLHIRSLLDRDPADIEALLGPPDQCEDADQRTICSYGDDHWRISITFADDYSVHVDATGLFEDLLFDDFSLAAVELPDLPPSYRQERQLRWENVAGISQITVHADADSTIERFEARR